MAATVRVNFALLLVSCLSGCQPSADPVRETPVTARAAPPAAATVGEPQYWWTSRRACLEALERDPPLRDPSRVRVVTWNVRYFPDGAHGAGRLHGGVDVAWLACAITRLDPDVLAVQEFKAGERLQPALSQLLHALALSTGSPWKFEGARCGDAGDSHVGVLWNTSRAQLNKVRELPELLLGRRCDDNLQPLLAAHFSFPSRLDFHLGVLHLVAGDRHFGASLREKQRRNLAPLVRALRRDGRDRDLVLAGDWNSSGCSAGCDQELSASDERRWLRRTLRRELGLKLVLPSIGCSDYYQGEPGLVDHFAVSSGLALPEEAVARVDGFCVEARCQAAQSESEAFRRLSDHCPVVLDIPARGGPRQFR